MDDACDTALCYPQKHLKWETTC